MRMMNEGTTIILSKEKKKIQNKIIIKNIKV